MRERQRHEMLRLELAQAAAQTIRLAEFGDGVRPAGAREQHNRDGMPAVALELAWRAVVAGDDEHIGVQLADVRDFDVELFDHLDLAVEIAVLASAVSVLVVQEEEV